MYRPILLKVKSAERRYIVVSPIFYDVYRVLLETPGVIYVRQNLTCLTTRAPVLLQERRIVLA